ncbi:MAG: tripartite-type tricarboxylate transporter receptor subunit TctC [Parasphingorhabdus sp.]|jgi:tripartite-type tricarboxylate transporter receptor subunit TctC
MNTLTKLLSAVVAGSLLLMGTAQAEYPDKPVSFVVPWPPGDLEDLLTRMIADEFQATYGMAAAVVNKPSGGGGPFPGAMEVANAPADGSMVGSFVIGVPVVGPLVDEIPIQADTFEPLGIFLTYPFVIATSMDAPYKSMEELAEYAKSNDVALGHFGPPLVPTKVTLALAKSMGFSYASDAAFDNLDCNSLASGDADVINTTIQLVLPCLDKVRILASVTDDPISLAPDAPTTASLAPELAITLWNGLFVRSGTADDVKEKIIAAAKKAVLGDKAQKLAKDTGAQVYWMDAEASKAQIMKDTETFKRIGQMLN